MTGFRVLDDEEKINRQPQRVRIKTVKQNSSLKKALTDFGVPQNRLEELAVLNGMTLIDNVEHGMLIKVVEGNAGSIAVKRN